MPMTATMAPYTLFILDDDTPLNPREDHDCLGKMVCWHSRYSLGEKHDYDEPSDFLRNLLFSEYSSGHDRNNPVFAFLKSGKAKDARLEYNRSTREWELRENQHWSSDSDWYVSSSYAASLKDEVPDWFLDDCLSALTTGELFSLVEQMDGMVILPLYLYDHSGITMNTCGFSCPWDSGQVGWIYYRMFRIAAECSLMLNGRGNTYEQKKVDIVLTEQEAEAVGTVVDMELCGHHPPEAEAILNSALEKIDRIAFAKVQTITCHGKDDYSLWSAEIPKDMLHSILHEACERVGTLDELMDAMNPKDGYEMRLFIQTPGRQFAFYRIPERLSNLEDYANEGCSVRGTKDEIMAEIFTEWAPAQEDLEDDFEL